VEPRHEAESIGHELEPESGLAPAMSDSITLRPIEDSDSEFLYRLYASTRESELAQVDWEAPEKERFLRQQFNAQHTYYQQQFPDARFDVVLEEGEPVGRLYIDRREDEFRLIDIALVPERRGAGLGGALMGDLLSTAAEADLPVQIHVERFNPALRLYERLGFEKVEDQGVYWLMKWTPGNGGSS